MTTVEMINVLSRSKIANPFKGTYAEAEKQPIDWVARNKLKNKIFRHSFIALLVFAVFSFVFIGLPLLIANPMWGKAFFLSLPIMLVLDMSWMIPAWRWVDKSKRFAAVMLGLVPFRICAALLYTVLIIRSMPEIPVLPFTLSLMWHWIIFHLPSLWMSKQFMFKLDRTNEEEP